MALLLPQHLADLRRSGLSDQTIDVARCRSESDPREIGKILGWTGPASCFGPCLVMPYANAAGEFNFYARIKPDRPRSGGGKYESPSGGGSRAYFTPGAVRALAEFRATVGITEGEKKSLAADQAGLPCIGLGGIWNWGKDRKLIDDLARIQWYGRLTWIGFDTDPRHSPDVTYAAAELARVLEDHGARVIIVELPVGPRGEDGRPGKNAIDDFIVARGEAAFRGFIEAKISPRKTGVSVEEFQQAIKAARLNSIGKPGIYLDASPTGAGKSSADMVAYKTVERSLTLVPTHKLGKEQLGVMLAAGMDAAKFPPMNADTCSNWNEAEKAIESGISPGAAICPTCPFRDNCQYLDERQDAQHAAHAIATHGRGIHTMGDVAAAREYITIHENAAGLLRPEYEVRGGDVAGLQQIKTIAQECRSWADDRTKPHFFCLQSVAEFLIDCIEKGDTEGAIEPPPMLGDVSLDAELWKTMKHLNRFPDGDVMAACKAIWQDKADEVVLRIDRPKGKGGQQMPRRTVTVFVRNPPPENATVWLNDATADAELMEAMIGRPVINATPAGELRHMRLAMQVAADITKKTTSSTVLRALRAILATLPQKRVGVICHQEHAKAIRDLKEPPGRIAKVEHFGGSQSRGSNEWIEECDLLVVLGTPRLPPHAIKLWLARHGLARAIEAAKGDESFKADRGGREDYGWGLDYWAGRTVATERLTVRTLGYLNRDWRLAWKMTVIAELKQSIGRARSIRPEGIPVVVVSKESLGLPIFAMPPEKKFLGDSAAKVVEAVRELCASALFPKDYSLRKSADAPSLATANTVDIAKKIGLQERRTRKILGDLEKSKIVERVGERGGWLLKAGH